MALGYLPTVYHANALILMLVSLATVCLVCSTTPTYKISWTLLSQDRTTSWTNLPENLWFLNACELPVVSAYTVLCGL